jgi:hypothetical protein
VGSSGGGSKARSSQVGRVFGRVRWGGWGFGWREWGCRGDGWLGWFGFGLGGGEDGDEFFDAGGAEVATVEQVEGFLGVAVGEDVAEVVADEVDAGEEFCREEVAVADQEEVGLGVAAEDGAGVGEVGGAHFLGGGPGRPAGLRRWRKTGDAGGGGGLRRAARRGRRNGGAGWSGPCGAPGPCW